MTFMSERRKYRVTFELVLKGYGLPQENQYFIFNMLAILPLLRV